MNSENKRAILCITASGGVLAKRLAHTFEADILSTERLNLEGAKTFEHFSDMVAFGFSKYDALVFIMATGIVVRSIAPHVKDKYEDPAVVVIDECGQYAISLLSGHIGGANALTIELADALGAHAVITTATDVHGYGAFELYLANRGIEPKPHRALSKWVNLCLVEGRPVWIIDEAAQISQPKGCTLGQLHEIETYEEGQVVYIGTEASAMSYKQCKAVIPLRSIVVGLGFRKGKSKVQLMAALETSLAQANILKASIACFATIELKAKEEGLIHLSQELQIPIVIIDEQAIQKVQQLFEGSQFVNETVGITSVCEPCAYLASGGNLIHSKIINDGITTAFGRK